MQTLKTKTTPVKGKGTTITPTVKGQKLGAKDTPEVKALKAELWEKTQKLAMAKNDLLDAQYEIGELKKKKKRPTLAEDFKLAQLSEENTDLKRQLALLQKDSVMVAINVNERELLEETHQLIDWNFASEVIGDLQSIFQGYLTSKHFDEQTQDQIANYHFTHYRICNFLVAAQEIKERIERAEREQKRKEESERELQAARRVPSAVSDFTDFCNIPRLKKLLTDKGLFNLPEDTEGMTKEQEEFFFLRELLNKLEPLALIPGTKQE